MEENILVLIKPDGVAKGICGEIITRFERRGLRLRGLKLMCVSMEQAEQHYAEHKGKPFFPELVNFMTSGPIVAMVIAGENAIKVVRTMMGPTNPAEALPGTIRGDFALSISNNIIHGSDSALSARREINIFFRVEELVG